MSFSRKLASAALIGAACLGLAATLATAQDKPAEGTKSVSETIKSLPNAKMFADALGPVGPMLDGQTVTVFVPSDKAMEKWGGKKKIDSLRNGPGMGELVRFIRCTMVDGKKMAADLKAGDLETMGGTPLKIAGEGDKVTVNGGAVAKADIACSNGVIHVVDAVPDVKIEAPSIPMPGGPGKR